MSEKEFDRILSVAIVVYLMILVACLCSSCSTAKPVVMERTAHDTAYVERVKVDSFLQKDSVYMEVMMKGDTVYKTKYVDRWRDRVSIRHDTVYATRTDSTSVPRTQEKKTSKWERTLVTVGRFALHALFTGLAVVVIGLIWLRRRKI